MENSNLKNIFPQDQPSEEYYIDLFETFNPEAVVDEHNRREIVALMMYFYRDPDFVSCDIVENPSLDKGICLVGPVGTGKSYIMSRFANMMKGTNMLFHMIPAREILDAYTMDGRAGLINYSTWSRICIDDMGTNANAVHYGNRENVIADTIYGRYDTRKLKPQNGNGSRYTHFTTNLLAEIPGMVGDRAASRMREMCNFISLNGPDRRV